MTTEGEYLQTMRTRAEAATPFLFTNSELIKLTTAAAVRHPQAVLGVLFGYRVQRELVFGKSDATEALRKLSITPTEFAGLFGSPSPETSTTKQINDVIRSDSSAKWSQNIETSLQTSFISEYWQLAWKRQCIRVAGQVALRMHRDIETFGKTMGAEVVGSDLRRLEYMQDELQINEDDSESYVLDLCNQITALAGTVTA